MSEDPKDTEATKLSDGPATVVAEPAAQDDAAPPPTVMPAEPARPEPEPAARPKPKNGRRRAHKAAPALRKRPLPRVKASTPAAKAAASETTPNPGVIVYPYRIATWAESHASALAEQPALARNATSGLVVMNPNDYS